MQAASQLAMDQIQKRFVWECFYGQISPFVWIKVKKVTFVSSAREKEENMKTVESLLEKGLIEVANKEEELKVGFVEKYKNTYMKESSTFWKRVRLKIWSWPFKVTTSCSLTVSNYQILLWFIW